MIRICRSGQWGCETSQALPANSALTLSNNLQFELMRHYLPDWMQGHRNTFEVSAGVVQAHHAGWRSNGSYWLRLDVTAGLTISWIVVLEQIQKGNRFGCSQVQQDGRLWSSQNILLTVHQIRNAPEGILKHCISLFRLRRHNWPWVIHQREGFIVVLDITDSC